MAGNWQAASGAVIAGTPIVLRVAVYIGVAAILLVGTWVVMSGTFA